ncbi:MAG: Kelch repeat-containing protein [Candidatus Hodarchaeales archaeon]|jgi:N-acetylneuraminic acid mutarotase
MLTKIKNRRVGVAVVGVSFVIGSIFLGNLILSEGSQSPQGRSGHGMVYDSNRNMTLLFGGMVGNGGSVLRDTWELNTSDQVWTKIRTEGNPSGKFNFGFVYDSHNKKAILFGGMNSEYDRTDEMWMYDSSSRTWSILDPSISPSPRSDPGMVYDSNNSIIILFGGYNIDDNLLDDTWVYFFENNTWKERFPETAPNERYGHSMCYDSQRRKTILFGGRVVGLTNELWEYDSLSDSWEKLSPNGQPLIRYWQAISYNPTDDLMILFGGDNEQTPERALADTWILNRTANEWTKIYPRSSPKARNNHAMIFDLQNNQAILFGGLGEDFQKNYQKTWRYSFSSRDWEELTI